MPPRGRPRRSTTKPSAGRLDLGAERARGRRRRWRSGPTPCGAAPRRRRSRSRPRRSRRRARAAAARRSPAAPRRRRPGCRRAARSGRRSSPDGSPAAAPVSITSIAAPILVRIPSRPIRVGLMPTPSSRTSLPGTIERRDEREGCRGEVARDLDRSGLEPRRPRARSADRPGGQLAADRHRRARVRVATRTPQRAQHPLGVIASRPGSITDGRRPRPAARRAAGTTSPGRSPPAARYSIPLQRARRDLERRQASLARPRSRRPSARSGSAIRSTGRRRIDSSPSRIQRPPGCPASQPGSRRIRVPALPTSTLAGRRAPAQADTLDPQLERARASRRLGDAGAEGLDRAEGRAGVGGVEVVRDPRLAVGHRRDQRGPVGDRLVRRRASSCPRSGPRGLEARGAHRLTRRPRRRGRAR